MLVFVLELGTAAPMRVELLLGVINEDLSNGDPNGKGEYGDCLCGGEEPSPLMSKSEL